MKRVKQMLGACLIFSCLQLLVVLIISNPVLANGSTPFQTITRIESMTYNGAKGTFISNCEGEGRRGCLLTPSCAGRFTFWIPVSDPLYKALLSTAMVSLTTSRPVVLRGSGVCYPPPDTSGYEILDAIDLWVPGT